MFTTKIPKGGQQGNFDYSQFDEASFGQTWTLLPLETAPASNLSDIAEADFVVVDDANQIPNVLE